MQEKLEKTVFHSLDLNPSDMLNSDMLGKPCGVCNENFLGKGIICSNCVTVQIQKDSNLKVIFIEINALFLKVNFTQWLDAALEHGELPAWPQAGL